MVRQLRGNRGRSREVQGRRAEVPGGAGMPQSVRESGEEHGNTAKRVRKWRSMWESAARAQESEARAQESAGKARNA